jgi:hypothetical protein
MEGCDGRNQPTTQASSDTLLPFQCGLSSEREPEHLVGAEGLITLQPGNHGLDKSGRFTRTGAGEHQERP